MNYSDKSYLGIRKYELREKTVFAKGDKFCESSFEMELPYENFSPYPDKLLKPSLLMQIGKPAAFFGLIVTLIFVFAERWGMEPEYSYSIAVLVVGVLLMIFGRNKLEIAQFKSESGTPLLWIVRAGEEKENFDAFVAEFLLRIQKASEKDVS